jgi:hypothetical protein
MAAEVRTTSSTGGQKGVKLARFDLIPAGPLHELAEHYGRGARKYANHQWRNGYEWSKSIGALGRHFNDFIAGKDYDTCSNEPENCAVKIDTGEVIQYHADQGVYIWDGRELNFRLADRLYRLYDPASYEPNACYNHTGSHHMAAVAWHAFLLLEFKDVHKDHDDRYRYPETKSELDELLDKIDPDHNAIALPVDQGLSQADKDRLFRVET